MLKKYIFFKCRRLACTTWILNSLLGLSTSTAAITCCVWCVSLLQGVSGTWPKGSLKINHTGERKWHDSRKTEEKHV